MECIIGPDSIAASQPRLTLAFPNIRSWHKKLHKQAGIRIARSWHKQAGKQAGTIIARGLQGGRGVPFMQYYPSKLSSQN